MLIWHDGRESPIEDATAPICHIAGDITGAVIVFRDVDAARAMALKMAHLTSVVELAEQALRPEDGGGLGTDALQSRQHGRRPNRPLVAGLSKPSRTASTVFYCSSRTSSRSNSRMIHASGAPGGRAVDLSAAPLQPPRQAHRQCVCGIFSGRLPRPSLTRSTGSPRRD